MNRKHTSFQQAEVAFRTTMEPLVFLGAGLVVLLIATFTVSFRAILAAQTDPVRALRCE